MKKALKRRGIDAANPNLLGPPRSMRPPGNCCARICDCAIWLNTYRSRGNSKRSCGNKNDALFFVKDFLYASALNITGGDTAFPTWPDKYALALALAELKLNLFLIGYLMQVSYIIMQKPIEKISETCRLKR